jgi:uncharacterized membrane protein YhaH (DUF805 family)
MKGQILDFSIQTNIGIISGEDGNRYNFVGQEWKDARPPSRGMTVDFDIDTMGSAVQVYLTQAQGLNQFAQNVEQQLHGVISNHDGKNEAEYNLVDWFIKCLKNYANFSGRARRKEYWFFILAQIIVLIIASILDGILFSGPSLFYFVAALGLFIPSLAAGVRRMHDTGRSGWLLLISLIPLLGLIVIYWLASDTKPESNQWGNPAK